VTAHDDPWLVHETSLEALGADALATVFTLSNGHLGVRGVLDGATATVPATLHASVHEVVPHTYAEPAYGYPETDERVVPVPDGWAVDVRVDGAALDPASGRTHRQERTLDRRAGVLDTALRWTAPSGATVDLAARRLVSLRRRELVVSSVEVRATDGATDGGTDIGTDSVRVELAPFRCRSAPVDRTEREPDEVQPLVRETCHHDVDHAWTVQHVPSSGVTLLVAADHTVEVPDGVRVQQVRHPHGAAVVADLSPGQSVRLLSTVAYAAGRGASQEDLYAQARAVLDGARTAGWARLQAEQRGFLDDVWTRGDVEVDGDPELQRAVRFDVFQVVQASARAEGTGIRAKGLSGSGYGGHTFWDADTFVLPVLRTVLPDAAAAHLRWRHSTLPQAVRRSRELGHEGAAFPWRTITGSECSGYWPAGSAAYHLTADVADAAVRHLDAHGDDAFGAQVAVDLAVHAARLWASLGHHRDGEFRIDGVTGPDEYSALADNNTFTNLMARRNLRSATQLSGRYPQEAARLGVTEHELRRWQRAADAMLVPFDHALGVTQQSEGFTRHAPWDFAAMSADDYPLDTHVTYGNLYRRQVVKQADLVLALYLAGDEFTPEQKRRDFDHYEAMTVRDSTLSAPAQAVVAAEVGHLELAHAYTRETALMDLRDLHGSTADGLHVAALAGAWTALTAGFGGVRDGDGALHLSPRLPDRLSRLRFRLLRGAALLDVEVHREHVTYRLLSGPALDLHHEGQPVRLTERAPQARRALSALPASRPPRQPPHREPLA
jgi:alpha,alpha-trehalose phosphorylase